MSDAGRKTPFREKGRLEVDWEARVSETGGENDPVPAKVTDLGLGGASLLGTLDFAEGADVQVEMEPANQPGRVLTLPGVVRWVKPADGGTVRVGVAFEDISPAQTAELADVLSFVPQVRDLED